ncbi:MAG: PAAR-like domain-containing protein, partial [bacterium]
AFPDVCLSPPSPPAGPIPIPYPDTSFSKDMKNGSRTVKIKGKEIMLKDKSFYKTSPLGDEAATKSLGQGVITHTITGKTYFVMWSMDVKIEGQNVDRHIDMTTSNHASPMANAAVPGPNVAAMLMASIEDDLDKCVCCKKKPRHSTGKAMKMDDWYTTDVHGNPLPDNDPKVVKYGQLMQDAKNRKNSSPPCTCNGEILPKAPCNVFRKPVSAAEYDKIKNDWKNERKTYQLKKGILSEAQVIADLTNKLGITPTQIEVENERKVNHLVPKTAGGCPTGDENLQPNGELCSVCRKLDKRFGDLQN